CGVFAAMFPDSQLAKSFTCGEKNPAYVDRYGSASFIKKELSCSVSEKPYVVMFDESMNKTTRSKQMDLHLRFWATDDEFGMLQNNGPLYSLVSLMKSHVITLMFSNSYYFHYSIWFFHAMHCVVL